MKKQSKMKKIINAIKNVICWALLIFLVITIIVFLMAKISGDEASFFGYSIYRISSGSMEPELEVGDVILDKKVENPLSIEVGDVITFEGSGRYDGMRITHEVIKAPYTNDEGRVVLQTQGLANDEPDPEISADSVIAVMVCKVPFLDAFYNLFFSPLGLVIFILLVLLIFLEDIINFIRAVSGNEKTAKDGEDINEIIERLQSENKNSKDKKQR